MKPKLIVINGMPGSGKMALGKKYALDHPFTLDVNVGMIRRFISYSEEHYQEASVASKSLALEMARLHLETKHDVVIAQYYKASEQLDALHRMAQEVGAISYEFYLEVSQEEAIFRYVKRGQEAGYPDGFRPEGMLAKTGGIAKLISMYEDLMAMLRTRSQAIALKPRMADFEGTYQELMKHVNHDKSVSSREMINE